MKQSQVNPVGRNQFPYRNESSRLRSPRDKDVTVRAWQMADVDSGNIRRMAQAIEILQRQLDRLRRRGGTADQAPETFVWYRGDWDEDETYEANQAVERTGLGMFVSLQAVAAGVAPESGAPNWKYWYVAPPGVWNF